MAKALRHALTQTTVTFNHFIPSFINSRTICTLYATPLYSPLYFKPYAADLGASRFNLRRLALWEAQTTRLLYPMV